MLYPTSDSKPWLFLHFIQASLDTGEKSSLGQVCLNLSSAFKLCFPRDFALSATISNETLNGECINMLALRIISTKFWCREVSRSDDFRFVSDPMNLHPRPRGATYPTCSWDLVGARFFALSMRFGEVSLCLCVFVCAIHIMAKRNRLFPPFPGRGQGN